MCAARNEYQNLPLHVACGNQASVDVVKWLVEIYPDAVQVKSNGGWLPLHYACRFQASFPVIKYLIKCYPKALEEETDDCWLPIHFACRYQGSTEITELLIRKFPESLKAKQLDGWLPLHVACRHQAPLSIIKLLVEKYPQAIEVPNRDGLLPLHYACAGASLDVIQFLVKRCPETIQAKTNRGSFPLHLACAWQAPLVNIQFIVEQCPKLVQVENLDHKTPLDNAKAPVGSDKVNDETIQWLQEMSGSTDIKTNPTQAVSGKCMRSVALFGNDDDDIKSHDVHRITSTESYKLSDCTAKSRIELRSEPEEPHRVAGLCRPETNRLTLNGIHGLRHDDMDGFVNEITWHTLNDIFARKDKDCFKLLPHDAALPRHMTEILSSSTDKNDKDELEALFHHVHDLSQQYILQLVNKGELQ